MHRLWPPRGQPILAGKKVLLIVHRQATRAVRAAIPRSHRVEVQEARNGLKWVTRPEADFR